MASSEFTIIPNKTRFFTVSTAGHVDHGKTSLLRALTGIDPDRLKEEKARQMTIDLGFAYLPLSPELVLGFVDVPGHGKFLKNMLAGVGGIDLSLLVVAADEGIMPQTSQHIRILSLLGIKSVLLVISKIDLIEHEDEIELLKEELSDELKKHGMQILAICPFSATKLQGIEELKASLMNIFSNKDNQQAKNLRLFLPVDRVFSKAGFGTVVTGTLVSGKLTVGDKLFIEPGQISCRVRRLETHGQQLNEASAGQRVACNLVVKDGLELSRGVILSSETIAPVRSIVANIADSPRTLKESLSERLSDQPIRLYHGTAEYHGYIRWLENSIKDSSYEEIKQSGIAFIALSEPAVLSAQDRFIIRLSDDTIYGGTILIKERPRWLSKSEIINLADNLAENNFSTSILNYLDEYPQLLLQEHQLQSILPENLIAKAIDKLIASGDILRLSEYIITARSRKLISEKLISQVKVLLQNMSNSDQEKAQTDGISLELLRKSLRPILEKVLFQALIEEECNAGTLVRKGDKIITPELLAQIDTSQTLNKESEKILQTLTQHWCLEWEELANLAEIDLKTCKNSVHKLVNLEKAVIVSYDFVACPTKIKEAHQILADIWNAKRAIAPTDFREKINTTRKYAMALLQYFDDQKITRRLDSGRVLLKGPQRS